MTALREIWPGLRAIAKRPALSLLVVGVLAAGLSCVIFMLVMVDAMLIRPLPFAAPEQLLQAGMRGEGELGDVLPVSDQDLLQIRAHVAAVAETAGVARSTINLSDLDRPERFNGGHASANLFRTLGVAPIIGRDFTPEDERPGAPIVVMLSYDLWQSRYNGDPAIAGRAARVDAQQATIIGVMPKDFSFPRREALWVAATLVQADKRDEYAYWIVMRRHADVAPAAVSAALDTWFADAAKADAQRFRGASARLEPLSMMVMDRTTRNLFGLLLAAAALVLLISCANAANLLLTAVLRNGQELAVRIALGASRRRLVVQQVVQSTLLVLLATGLALLLARVVVAWQEDAVHRSEFALRWVHFEITPTVVLFAFAAGIVSAIAAGVLPALRVGATATAAGMRNGSRTVAGASSRLSRWLLIGQVAMSSALLVCVGTLVRGVGAMERVDLGIDTAHLLTARVLLPSKIYPTVADQVHMFERIGDRLRGDAEVVDASLGNALPGTFYNWVFSVVADSTVDPGDDLPQVGYAGVDDHFLGAWGVKLQEGRFFDQHDAADSVRVAVVDRRFADRFADGRSIIGRTFRVNPRDPESPTVSVIGVMDSLMLVPPGDVPLPTMLVPLRQAPFKIASVAVRTRADAAAFAPRLNEIMREIDADTPLYWVREYDEILRDMSYGERLIAQRFGLFGIIALGLAAASLYGVATFMVLRRTREIGVRRALGAPAPRILRGLFARIGVQLAAGLVAGIGSGLVFARLLTQSLPAIAPSGLLDICVVVVVLATAGLVAVAVPALRALRIDPIVALRNE